MFVPYEYFLAISFAPGPSLPPSTPRATRTWKKGAERNARPKQGPPFWRKHVLRWPPKNGMVDDCELWNFLLGPDWTHKWKMQVVHARNPSGKQSLPRHCQKITQWDTGSNDVTRIWFRSKDTYPYTYDPYTYGSKKGGRQKRPLNGEIQQVADILWVIQPRRWTQPLWFRGFISEVCTIHPSNLM